MSETIPSLVAIVCLVLGIMSIRAVFDKARPRLDWARPCLVILAIVAVLAGIIGGLEVSGKGVQYLHFRPGAHPAQFFKGMTLGLFFVLYASGQWSGKGQAK